MPRARHIIVGAICCLTIGLTLKSLSSSSSTFERLNNQHSAEHRITPVDYVAHTEDTAPSTALKLNTASILNSVAADVDISTLHVTYENCIAGLHKHRRKHIHKLHWLHFPKCGTSLGTVVHGYLCQSEPSSARYRLPGRHRDSVCDYCELEQMNKQGTPFWDGKIRALLPSNPEIRKYCDWNVSNISSLASCLVCSCN